MANRNWVGTAALALSLLGFVHAAEKPNVILIFADDLGPGMLGCYGQKIIKTPHIDRLAAEGMKFNNYYGATFCAPSRWALATGMHDGRVGGWDYNKAGLPIERDAGRITEEEYQKKFAQLKKDTHPVAPNEVFLGQIGQQGGYKTAQFGKLDVGFLTWHEKVKRYGWDYYDGFYDHRRCHGYYPPYLWRNGERYDLPGNNDPDCGKFLEQGDLPAGSGGETHSQIVMIEAVLKYIRENRDEPFFLYHPTQLPHGELGIPAIHPDFVNDDRLTYEEKKYASMIKMLDDHVGLILAELKKQGIDGSTIVLFSSDNGHCPYYSKVYDGFKNQTFPDGSKADWTGNKWRTSNGGDVFDGNGGLAGAKRSGFQGGIICPMLVRWPGKINPGTETDLLSTHYDFLATLADIGGVEVPKGKDSISYLPTLLSQPQKKTHDFITVQNKRFYMGSSTVIARDGFKLVEIGKKRDQYQLYNILKDSMETTELSAKYPEKVEQLKQILKREVVSKRPDLRGE
ncbi:arylsulfatase [Pontiella sulfatireligans]|uniref:Arylsulfatase n=1 Tax=Pontiella sulfatireligans TaxID=2750658 RepID=A0A6C2UHH8_9BACT|nr:arylsulfatase [Pontiella sulfatireligans]SPS74377.1 sulfatase S1_20 [Kiritimatiellales bacterium]VGO19662.1 Arylsulfatase [Pontiella sulfatireligans]